MKMKHEINTDAAAAAGAAASAATTVATSIKMVVKTKAAAEAAARAAAASVLISCFIFILHFGFSFDLILIFALFCANTGMAVIATTLTTIARAVIGQSAQIFGSLQRAQSAAFDKRLFKVTVKKHFLKS